MARPGTDRRHACRVAWRAEAGTAGAALLEIVDEGWRSPGEPPAIRWGVLAGRGGWTPGRVPGAVDSSTLEVAVNPLAFVSDQRLQVDLDAASASRAAADQYPDGAPLVCHDLVTGVTIWDETGDGERRLTAVPTATLLLDRQFRELVEQATGVPPHPEPVELEFLLHPWRPGTPPRTPADLLRPEYGAVPFQGRRGTQAQLETWCHNGTMVSALLLTGAAGQGKTRLARQLAEALCQQGWVAGVLGERPPVDWLDAVSATDKPLLLIVERPAGRIAQIAALIGRLAERPTGQPVRLLLLARAADQWWRRLATELGDHTIAVEPEPVTVPELAPEARRVEFERAVEAFAGHIAKLPYSAARPPGADLPGSLRSAGPVVALHAGALAGLLAQGPDHAAAEQLPAAETILAAEVQAWERAASRLPPEARPGWRRAITVALLCGAEHRSQAVELLACIEGRDGGAANAQVLAEWVRELLPPQDARHEFWGTLQPELLRAYHLAGEPPGLLPALLPAVSDRLVEVALTRLGEAAAIHAEADGPDTGRPLVRQLATLIADHPDVLGPAAVRAATSSDSGAPLIAALEQLADTAIDVAACERIAAAIPEPAGPLAGCALRLHQRIVDHHRAAATDPGVGSVVLGAALVASSGPLAELGQTALAADATAEAVARYRAAAGTVPPALAQPRLAAVLRVHAGRLAGAGRTDEALAALDDARAESRRLPADEAGRQLAEIADSMVELAQRRLAAAEPAAAAVPAQRAIDIRRALIRRREPEHVPGLHAALDTLGRAWLAAGELPRALTALDESAALCRRLARSRGGGYLPALGTALDRLSEVLFLAGRERAAAAVSEEAVAVHRQLAEQWPARLPAVAAATRTLSGRLAAAGRHEQALAAADEAVAHYHELAERERRFAAATADALHTRAIRLSELGRWGAAVATGTDAVTAYRRLDGSDADPSPALAASLTNLSVILGEAGLASQGLGVGDQAIDLYQRLVSGGETGYLPHLAAALTNRAVQLAQVSQPTESLAAAEQAVELYQRMPADAARFRDGYALALGTLARHRLVMGQVAEGEHASQLGVALLRELAGEDPDRYLPHYATALLDLGGGLAAHGRWAASAGATALAAQACRDVLVMYPTADRGPLSEALRLLTRRLAADGRPDQAVATAQERVALHRDPAAGHGTPDLAALADALDDLAAHQAAGGWYDRAVAAVHESLEVRAQLSVPDPRTHLPRLAASWRALSRYLAAWDRAAAGGEDLTAALQAVESSRRLAQVDLEAYLRHLAPSVRLLAQRQAAAGQWEAAADTAAEAADHYLHLARLEPARFQPELAAALAELTTLQASAGRLPESLQSARLAVEVHRQLAGNDPQRRGQLAGALMLLSAASSKLERLEPAFAAAAEAANIYRELAQEQPDPFAALHAAALLHAAGTGRPWRDRTGRRTAAREAVLAYRRLADRWPGRFDRELASARAGLHRGRVPWPRRMPAGNQQAAGADRE